MKRASLVLAFLSLLACESGTTAVRVTKIAVIDQPNNLLDTDECRSLWGNIQRFGLEMDKASPEWNGIIIKSAYELIEKGCVKSRQAD